MERFSLISPEPHMPDTDLRLRKLMEIEEAIEAYVRDNDVSRLNQLLSDPEYESLFLKRLRLTNRHEIWNIIHLPPEERKNRLLPYRQLGFHCYRKQLVSIPCTQTSIIRSSTPQKMLFLSTAFSQSSILAMNLCPACPETVFSRLFLSRLCSVQISQEKITISFFKSLPQIRCFVF